MGCIRFWYSIIVKTHYDSYTVLLLDTRTSVYGRDCARLVNLHLAEPRVGLAATYEGDPRYRRHIFCSELSSFLLKSTASWHRREDLSTEAALVSAVTKVYAQVTILATNGVPQSIQHHPPSVRRTQDLHYCKHNVRLLDSYPRCALL